LTGRSFRSKKTEKPALRISEYRENESDDAKQEIWIYDECCREGLFFYLGRGPLVGARRRRIVPPSGIERSEAMGEKLMASWFLRRERP
jgi:hypothetical protein